MLLLLKTQINPHKEARAVWWQVKKAWAFLLQILSLSAGFPKEPLPCGLHLNFLVWGRQGG